MGGGGRGDPVQSKRATGNALSHRLPHLGARVVCNKGISISTSASLCLYQALPPRYQDSKITKAVRLWTGKTSEAVFRAWHQFTKQAVASGHHADGYYALQAW